MNPYDDVPYPSHAFAATSPDRLAVIGAIFGLDTVDPRRARVLELGSSSGGNMLGHAAAHPASTVLGLDLSERQVRLGQRTLRELGLDNARIEVADLRTWEPEEGAWDYVICHGVYSWVPEPVQQAILRICRRALSPHGVAVVSWNANPGWHVQGMVRDAMRYLVDPETPLSHRAARGQDVVRVLATTATTDSPHARMLGTVASQFEVLPDAYIAHEYLETDNQPLYLAEFTRHAAQAGLRYLTDSQMADAMPQLQPPAIQQRLQGLATSQIELEQYIDFLSCRPFHTSLLVRPEAPVRLDLDRFDPTDLWLARADLPQDDPWPLSTALLRLVHAARPGTLSFADAAAALDIPLGMGLDAAGEAPRELAHAVLSGFLTGRLTLHRDPHRTVARAGQRPEAWRVSRHQAGRQHLVTNQWHDTLVLDPLDLLLLHLCDGTRTLEQLLDLVRPTLATRDSDPADLLRIRLDALSDKGFFVA